MITITAAVPLPGGLTTVSEVLELTTAETSTAPNRTPAPAAKPVPVTVTVVPPLGGPLVGLIAVTVGTGR